MNFPTTQLCISLPESFGIIENVNAIISLCNKEFSIPCKHVLRYYSVDGQEWPKEVFDSNLELVNIDFKINNDNEPNTSFFQGTYTFFDETCLEGDFYFMFDCCKDGQWYNNFRTNSLHFKEDKEDYYDLKNMLNEK